MKRRTKTITLLLTMILCIGMILPAEASFAAGKTAYLPAKFTYKGDIPMYMKYIWNAQGGLEKQITGMNDTEDSAEILAENTYYPSGKVKSQTRYSQGQELETTYFSEDGRPEKMVMGTEESGISVKTYKYNDRGYLQEEKVTSSLSTQEIRTVHKYKYHSNGKPSKDTAYVQWRDGGKWQKHGTKTVKRINKKGYATEIRTYEWSKKKKRYVKSNTEKLKYTYNKQSYPTKIVYKAKGWHLKVKIRYSKVKATRTEFCRAFNDRMQVTY